MNNESMFFIDEHLKKCSTPFRVLTMPCTKTIKISFAVYEQVNNFITPVRYTK